MLKEKDGYMFIAYSIGIFFLKYYLNKSHDEIRDFNKEQPKLKNQVFNEFLINSFNLSQIKKIEYINNIEELCTNINHNNTDDNNSIIMIPQNDVNNGLHNEENELHDEENELINIKIVNNDNIILDKNEEKKQDPPQAIIQVQDPSLRCCPHCKSLYIFDGGCKFITCESAYCKKKKYFCHLCGNRLQPSEKISHFPKGIYGNSCLIVKL